MSPRNTKDGTDEDKAMVLTQLKILELQWMQIQRAPAGAGAPQHEQAARENGNYSDSATQLLHSTIESNLLIHMWKNPEYLGKKDKGTAFWWSVMAHNNPDPRFPCSQQNVKFH